MNGHFADLLPHKRRSGLWRQTAAVAVCSADGFLVSASATSTSVTYLTSVNASVFCRFCSVIAPAGVVSFILLLLRRFLQFLLLLNCHPYLISGVISDVFPFHNRC